MDAVFRSFFRVPFAAVGWKQGIGVERTHRLKATRRSQNLAAAPGSWSDSYSGRSGFFLLPLRFSLHRVLPSHSSGPVLFSYAAIAAVAFCLFRVAPSAALQLWLRFIVPASCFFVFLLLPI